MKSWNSPILMCALLAVGLLGAATPVIADLMDPPLPADPGSEDILSFAVVGHDEFNTFLTADVTPALDGKPATILFGSEPLVGMPIAETTLHAGTNLIAVPNPHLAGWYTITTCGRAKSIVESDPGINY